MDNKPIYYSASPLKRRRGRQLSWGEQKLSTSFDPAENNYHISYRDGYQNPLHEDGTYPSMSRPTFHQNPVPSNIGGYMTRSLQSQTASTTKLPPLQPRISPPDYYASTQQADRPAGGGAGGLSTASWVLIFLIPFAALVHYCCFKCVCPHAHASC